MPKHQIAVLLIIESDDPRLSTEWMQEHVRTAGDYASHRRRILQSLPDSVSRLVGVLPVDLAEMMMKAHEIAAAEIGLQGHTRPPADYVPPTRE